MKLFFFHIHYLIIHFQRPFLAPLCSGCEWKVLQAVFWWVSNFHWLQNEMHECCIVDRELEICSSSLKSLLTLPWNDFLELIPHNVLPLVFLGKFELLIADNNSPMLQFTLKSILFPLSLPPIYSVRLPSGFWCESLKLIERHRMSKAICLIIFRIDECERMKIIDFT